MPLQRSLKDVEYKHSDKAILREKRFLKFQKMFFVASNFRGTSESSKLIVFLRWQTVSRQTAKKQ
jgi:hypothetical protein